MKDIGPGPDEAGGAALLLLKFTIVNKTSDYPVEIKMSHAGTSTHTHKHTLTH